MAPDAPSSYEQVRHTRVDGNAWYPHDAGTLDRASSTEGVRGRTGVDQTLRKFAFGFEQAEPDAAPAHCAGERSASGEPASSLASCPFSHLHRGAPCTLDRGSTGHMPMNSELRTL